MFNFAKKLPFLFLILFFFVAPFNVGAASAEYDDFIRKASDVQQQAYRLKNDPNSSNLEHRDFNSKINLLKDIQASLTDPEEVADAKRIIINIANTAVSGNVPDREGLDKFLYDGASAIVSVSPPNIVKNIKDGVLDKMGQSLYDGMMKLLTMLVDGIFYIIATVFGFIGWFLDAILNKTVFNFGATYNIISESVETSWIFLRDLSNIVFIFLILSTAISIIINGDLFGKKKVLAQIIIVAVLINFSMFFVKSAVDVSNFATNQIYESIILGDGTQQKEDWGIGVQITSQLGLTSFLAKDTAGAKGIVSNLNIQDPFKLAQLVFFMGIFLGLTGIVFLYTALMLVWRFLAVILLIIVSPAALVSTILPQGKAFWDYWVKELSTNLFFPPVFFLLLNIVFIFSQRSFESLGSQGKFSDLASLGSQNLNLLLNFILILTFLFIAVWASRKISVSGSGLTAGVITSSSKYATGRMKRVVGGGTAGLAGSAGRRTLGAAASAASRAPFLSGNNFASRKLRGGLERVGNSSFDVRDNKTVSKKLGSDFGKGYNDAIEQRTKDLTKRDSDLAKLSTKEELAKTQFTDGKKAILSSYRNGGEKDFGRFSASESKKLNNELINLRDLAEKDPANKNKYAEEIKQKQLQMKELNELKSLGNGIAELVKLEKLSNAGNRRQREFRENTLSNKTYLDKIVKNKEGKYRTGGRTGEKIIKILGINAAVNKVTNKNVAGQVANNKTKEAINKKENETSESKTIKEAVKKEMGEQQKSNDNKS